MKFIPIILIIVLCMTGCVTRTMWNDVYPDYVELSLADAPREIIDLRNANVLRDDNWYWSEDGTKVYVKRPVYQRYTGNAVKALATPITITVDGVSIFVSSLPDIMTPIGDGLATMAPLVEFFAAIGYMMPR
jgi:hypothetical protein